MVDGQRKIYGKEYLGVLPRVRAIVVGLDIREYSRRTPEQQMFLTMNLHVCIEKAVELLRQFNLPEAEPRIRIQTGDGAYVVFTFVDAWDEDDWRAFEVEPGADLNQSPAGQAADPSPKQGDRRPKISFGAEFENSSEDGSPSPSQALKDFMEKRRMAEGRYLPVVAEQAMSFVFALNAIMNGDNARQGFAVDPPGAEVRPGGLAAFPTECRFALSYEEVLLLETNGVLNCVGNGMVTCARILATDHGSHLLMDYELLRALERHGGLRVLCGGKWNHRLHSAVLDEVKVKSGTFRYADIFGFYDDTPLLSTPGLFREKPRQYHIGSHNVLSIGSP
jgi:hypothetical protein